MNFRDMTRDDIEYYNRIRKPGSSLDLALKDLAVAAFVIATALAVWVLG